MNRHERRKAEALSHVGISMSGAQFSVSPGEVVVHDTDPPGDWVPVKVQLAQHPVGSTQMQLYEELRHHAIIVENPDLYDRMVALHAAKAYWKGIWFQNKWNLYGLTRAPELVMPVNWKIKHKFCGSKSGEKIEGEFAMTQVEIYETGINVEMHCGYSNMPCVVWIELIDGRPVVRLYSRTGARTQ